MNRPRLIILVGIPGSGKSTYADTFDKKTSVHLSSDKIREELYGDESIQGNPELVFSLMKSRAVEALNNGKDVIYDATNITRKDRASIISVCPKFARIDAHVVWASIEDCIERDANRNRTVGKEVIDKMLKRFQAPYYDEGIDEIFIYRTTNKVFYLNELDDAMKIPHDNPHHSVNIYEHSQLASSYAIKNNFELSIIDAACYHDCGKPYVKCFKNNKGEDSDVAHYYSHQNVSAWLSYGIMNYYIVEIAWLISTHMDPFMDTKYYRNLPAYLKEKVDQLHEADLAAH